MYDLSNKIEIFVMFYSFIFFQEVDISDEEKTFSIDLRPFMNPSPYTVLHVRTIDSKNLVLFNVYACCFSLLL